MNIKERLNKISEQVKTLLAFEETPVEASSTAEESGEYALADGTMIKVASLEVGQAVTIITPEGEVAATAGDLTMEDGSILTIADDGTITSITPAPEAAPEAMDMAAIVEQVTAKVVSEFSAILTAKDEKIEAIEKANNALIAKHKETLQQFSELLNVVEEIGSQTPAPITEQKSTSRAKNYFS